MYVSPLTWVLIIGGVAAGSSAADTLTSFNDRDIDAIMDRTKGRPIPTGRISPKNALMFGLILTIISLVLAWLINIWAFALMVFGLFDNIVVYSKWLKRKVKHYPWRFFRWHTRSNRVCCGDYTKPRDRFGDGQSCFSLDTHSHLSLALHAKKDYTKAGIPMLPVISGERKSVRIIAGTTLLMVIFSILPFFLVNLD